MDSGTQLEQSIRGSGRMDSGTQQEQSTRGSGRMDSGTQQEPSTRDSARLNSGTQQQPEWTEVHNRNRVPQKILVDWTQVHNGSRVSEILVDWKTGPSGEPNTEHKIGASTTFTPQFHQEIWI